MAPRMKSNLELVQELLENRLDNLNEKIDTNNENLAEKIDINNKNLLDKVDTNNKNILELLNFIREQTTKTNGRVTKLESNELFHYNNCPRVKDIEVINKSIETLQKDSFILQIWNKYPKQATLGLVMSLLLFVGSIGYGIYQVREALIKIQIEQSVKNDNTN